MPTKLRLIEAAGNLSNQVPSRVYSHLINCLILEQQLLHQTEHLAQNPTEVEAQQVTQLIDQQLNLNHANENARKEWINRNEAYRCRFYEITDRNSSNDVDMEAVLASDAHQAMLFDLELQATALNNDRIELVGKFNTSIENGRILTEKVVDHYLKQWKLHQKLYGSNFAIIGADLDTIQCWCERLAEVLWNTKVQVQILIDYQQQFTVDEKQQSSLLDLHTAATNIISKLFAGSLIVVQQPPQVMKTINRFSAQLRLLTGNVLNIKMNNPILKVKIVSEFQAQRIFQSRTFSGASCGEIINDSATLEYNEASRQLTATFRNMQLRAFRRPGRKAADSVTDEKFALWFRSNITIGDLNVTVDEMSLPVVVS